MITFYTAAQFIVGHVLAGAVVILGTLFVTFACCIVGFTAAPDFGDTPVAEFALFLTWMFMGGVVGVIASTCSFLISTGLQLFRSKRRFPVWLPVVVVPLLTFFVVLSTFGWSRGMGFAGLMTGMAFVYFGIYWTLLMSSSSVLDFIRAKLFRKHVNPNSCNESKAIAEPVSACDSSPRAATGLGT